MLTRGKKIFAILDSKCVYLDLWVFVVILPSVAGLLKVSFTPYRIAQDSKIVCPFVSVHMRFLSVLRAVNAFYVR